MCIDPLDDKEERRAPHGARGLKSAELQRQAEYVVVVPHMGHED